MGCCILGALIISRCIYAWRRVRVLFRRIGPLFATLVAAEVALLVAAAVHEAPRHRDHLLSLLPAMAFAAGAEPAICTNGDGKPPHPVIQ
ncbi:MAG: hypothetical protein JWR89_2781 [Tardiphaga sp.]|uniref:hypothetical protein n=1 Tax=Tardiphaga sp. TaxID=1926292 RepID=UPI00262D269F|nr:hypothetical protein [Tardiphaga sp.]MDB5502879.1 hypothetical protein [Tardiphaga sp.]